jgi:hypothetical protein
MRRRKGAVISGDEQLVLASLTEIIKVGRVAIIGPIRQEVLSGIKYLVQFEKLRFALEAFPDEPLTTLHHEEAARLYNLCRSRGVECGSTDILICAVAVQTQWTILTYDHGLKRCVEVLRSEGLMR